uniref:Uncharacterized protein n=1 Tax=Anguilla anguilla TaxID=7936 RepID=A0A0E9R8P9_ANGAN
MMIECRGQFHGAAKSHCTPVNMVIILKFELIMPKARGDLHAEYLYN